jgi:hypothetical protein
VPGTLARVIGLALWLLQAAPVGDAGRPGVAYRIEARLDETTHVLYARGTLAYRNASPDTLGELVVHLYLNAFRPHSLWARTERRPQYAFGALAEPDYAFERLGRVAVRGVEVRPEYPYAPDSTVARLPLPRPLPPGDSVVVELEWTARLSTLWRRQGRAGRHYDWAHGYPRIAVYDRYGWQGHPLYPQGEFYGEFATYDVTLDLAADQVVAATGVPVEGDPGWERAAVAGSPVTHLRDAYGRRAAGREAAAEPPPGRKRVRFRAERVHHFAWSCDPAFRYEEGRYGDVVLRVLYRPESAPAWSGRVLAYAARALAFLDSVFGPYPWPQLTIAERLEGGGTEFPMLVMNGGASESLVVHEVAHQYVHGALANNEWREGWLDEGFATFLARRYLDARYGPVRAAPGRGLARHRIPLAARAQDALRVLWLDAFGWSQPVSWPSEDYTEFLVYNRMIYTKGSLVLESLAGLLGEETFARGLREYYRRHALSHVDETDFRTSLEDVCRCDLRPFFAQRLHGTGVVDDAVARAERVRTADGWLTRVELERRGTIVLPADVAVRGADGREVRRRTRGLAPRETLLVATPWRPESVVVDPDDAALDLDRGNNVHAWGFRWGRPGARRGFDWPFVRELARDPVETWFPLAGYTDAGGLALGVRTRSNRMGWLDASESGLAVAWKRVTDRPGPGGGVHGWVRVRNPPSLVGPRREAAYAVWWVEDRWGAELAFAWDRSQALAFGPRVALAAGARLMAAEEGPYLPPALWEPGATLEAWGAWAVADTIAGAPRVARVGAALGAGRVDDAFGFGDRVAGYTRVELEAATRRPLTGGLAVDVRAYAGAFVDLLDADAGRPRQRRLALAGADPYATFWNPFLRSRGALFRRGDVRVHAPGGPNLRSLDPDSTALGAASLQARLAARVPGPRGVRASAFATAGLARRPGPGAPALGIFEAGLGFHFEAQVVDERIHVGVDLPVYLSRPGLGDMGRDRRWAWRWVLRLSPEW